MCGTMFDISDIDALLIMFVTIRTSYVTKLLLVFIPVSFYLLFIFSDMSKVVKIKLPGNEKVAENETMTTPRLVLPGLYNL